MLEQRHLNAELLKSRELALLILCSQEGLLHTSALQTPSVRLEIDGKRAQDSPDWLTQTAQGQPTSPCSTMWGLSRQHILLPAGLKQ